MWPKGNRVPDGSWPFWPGGARIPSGRLQSSSLSTSLADFGIGLKNSCGSSDFISPSVLNAETPPELLWPGSATFGAYGTSTWKRLVQGETVPVGVDKAMEAEVNTSDRPYKRLRCKNLSGGNALATATRHADTLTIKSVQSPRQSNSKGTAPATASAKGRSKSLVSPSIQLRTASRKAKRASRSYRPAISPKEKCARNRHNQVEKRYCNRLNQHFERLIAVLPVARLRDDDPQDGEQATQRLSKAEVLDIARRHIRSLETENSKLEAEGQQLVADIKMITQTEAYPNQGGFVYSTSQLE